MRGSKKILALLLAASMVFSMLSTTAFAAEGETNIFLDVAETNWFYKAVQYVSENEIMVGTSETEFSPYTDVNRAMVVTVLYRMEEAAEKPSAPSTFSDVEEGAWYTDAVIWAEKNGIAGGYEDGTFLPLRSVSREELVTFLYRWANYKGRSDVGTTSDMRDFIDAGSVQEYAREAMSWAVATGLVTGMTDDTICPHNTADRAQLAMILYRLQGQDIVIVDDPNPPLSETPGTSGGGGGGGGGSSHTHSYTNWTDNGNGTHTGTCAADNATTIEAHTYDANGVCVCGAKNAEGVTRGAVTDLNTKLAGITGNGGAQLVTVTQNGNQVSAVLDTDAIKGAGQSFDDDLLNGLMTNIKTALDETFGDYTLTVAGKDVYSDKAFNNTALKAAIYDVSGGFFYTLANMQDESGVYTYKTVSAVVTNTDNSADTYSFNLDIQLKGGDVAKVQEMASILEKHLSMTKMDAAEVQDKYGVAVTSESEFIVVSMEMPDKIMAAVKKQLENGNVPDEAITEFIAKFNNGAEVKNILGIMAGLPVEDMIGSGQEEVATLISMVNSNKNLVNKVMSKLTIKVQTIATVDGKNAYTGLLVKEDATFNPATADWKGLVNAIVAMLDDDGGNVVPGQFKTTQKDHYLVPITVDIDLDSSMGFKATETVLFDLHIPLSELGSTTEPEPAEKTDEEVTKEAVAKVQEVLAGFKGHENAQLVTLTETGDGKGYDLNLDVSAVVAGDAITDGAGLATKLGEAMQTAFEGRVLSVNGQKVYSDGKFNNTELKNALFDVSDGFFYTLAHMKEDGVYKTVEAAVGNYKFDVNVKLSGDDVDRVKTLAGKLEKYLSMNKMDANAVKEAYGHEGSESEYIVIDVEMPEAAKDALAAAGKETADVFNSATVMNALQALAAIDVPSYLGDNAANINPVIETVNGNADLVNTVLRHATITVADQELGTTFTPGSEGSEWQKFMAGVLEMVKDLNFGVIGEYAVDDSGTYVVPVTVDIDLGSSLGFTANETVLVVLHIPFATEDVTE